MNLTIIIILIIILLIAFYFLGKKQKENEIIKKVKFHEKSNINDVNIIIDKLQKGKF